MPMPVPVPCGRALILLYLGKRNLVIVMIAHFIVDLPLVVISMRSSG